MPGKTRRSATQSSSNSATGGSSAQDFGSNAAIQERLKDSNAPDKFKQTATGKLVQIQTTDEGATRVWYRMRYSPDMDPYWTAFLDGGASVYFLADRDVQVRGSEVSFVVDESQDAVGGMDRVVPFLRGKHD